MISLTQLIKEIQSQPTAIFITGAAGSGKSYIKNKIIPSSFIEINSDNEYEKLLKQSGLGLKIKDFDSEKLSQASKFQKQALKKSEEDYLKSKEQKQNIVIDLTGASYDSIKKKYLELHSNGYNKIIMIMVYVNPLTSLERNSQRDRSLRTNMVLNNWAEVYKNITPFSLLFKNNFYLIKNDDKEHTLDLEQIKQYYNQDNKITSKNTPSKQNNVLDKLESVFYKNGNKNFSNLNDIKI